MHGLAVLRGSLSQGDRGKEKDYEVQNNGSGGIGRGVRRGHGGGDRVGRRNGGGGGEDARGSGAGAASYRAEGHQPDGDGRGHCFAAARSTGYENASDRAEYVAVGRGGAEVLADLQPLREGLAGSERPEVCAVEAVRGDVGNDVRPGCTDLCAALAGGGWAGAGAALEVCADREPGVAGKEGGNVFSVGPAAEHDHRSAVVFADSVGACEGVGGKRYRTTKRARNTVCSASCRLPHDRCQCLLVRRISWRSV